MKKIITIAILVSLICISSNKAFASLRCPFGIEIEDPNPVIFQNDLR